MLTADAAVLTADAARADDDENHINTLVRITTNTVR